MPKQVSALELSLAARPAGYTLVRWLYEELRHAILEGRLRRGARLPASRDFARQYGVSRGTVMAAFTQLQAEGYLTSRVGAGTRVSGRLPEDWLPNGVAGQRPVPAATQALPAAG